jgi:pyridoxamine 5'-phosphate oxidase
MIEFLSFQIEPLKRFKKHYFEAVEKNQPQADAMCLSSVDLGIGQPDSRFVNLKYILDDELIFFSNYKSKKSQQFISCSNISCIFFWHATNLQIKVQGSVSRTPSDFSNSHFKSRSAEKNALAISSMQSSKISSYESVLQKYNKTLLNSDLFLRPKYWGGYSITPHYFEFWKGDPNRVNHREEFKLKDNEWIYSILEP